MFDLVSMICSILVSSWAFVVLFCFGVGIELVSIWVRCGFDLSFIWFLFG